MCLPASLAQMKPDEGVTIKVRGGRTARDSSTWNMSCQGYLLTTLWVQPDAIMTEKNRLSETVERMSTASACAC
jgi:hypothetical protein